MQELFEADMVHFKKAIKENSIPNCEEVKLMEFTKDKDGDYTNALTATYYQTYLMAYNQGRTSVLKEVLGD
jgi:hypothetical protein